jgi:hypothetical protein
MDIGYIPSHGIIKVIRDERKNNAMLLLIVNLGDYQNSIRSNIRPLSKCSKRENTCGKIFHL